MIGKKNLTAFLCLIFLASNAQTDSKYGIDSTKCEDSNQIYYDLYKAKSYTDAYPYWKWMFDNCPLRTKNIYIHGPNIVKKKISQANNDIKKEQFIDTLLMIYDNRLLYFPGKEGYVLGKKGSDLMKYRKEEAERAFYMLQKSISLEVNNSQASTLSYYIKASATLFNKKDDEGNRAIAKSEIMDIYATVIPIIDYNLIHNKKNTKSYQQALDNIETMLGPLFNCETLIPIYREKLSENITNAAWLSKAYNMLKKKKCINDSTFFNITNALNNIEPTAILNADLGKFSLDKNQNISAIEFYKLACELELDDSLKSDYHLYLAQAYKKIDNFSSARANAQKASKYRKSWGAPYLLIGDLYAGSAKYCGKNDLERKAIYWAAIEKYEYAKYLDASIKDAANERINTYSPFMPDKTLLFDYGYLEKETYTIGCWINETVKVKTPN